MKKNSLLLFFLLFSITTIAQDEINTTFGATMNATFGNIDKTKVPHGLLLDFGMEFTKS